MENKRGREGGGKGEERKGRPDRGIMGELVHVCDHKWYVCATTRVSVPVTSSGGCYETKTRFNHIVMAASANTASFLHCACINTQYNELTTRPLGYSVCQLLCQLPDPPVLHLCFRIYHLVLDSMQEW